MDRFKSHAGLDILRPKRVQNICRKLSTRDPKNYDVSKWFYCKTKQNPADLLTRRKIFETFYENKFWFQGPDFSKQKLTFENRDFQNSFDVEHAFSHELKEAYRKTGNRDTSGTLEKRDNRDPSGTLEKPENRDPRP